MSDVFEYIVDGTSGLSGGTTGSVLVAGTCTLGVLGKSYICGNRTDIRTMLGTGTLVDRLEDIFAQGGANPIVIAVPIGDKPELDKDGNVIPKTPVDIEVIKDAKNISTLVVSATGTMTVDASVVIKITESGILNKGRFQYSLNGGKTFSADITLPVESDFILEDTGVTIKFPVAVMSDVNNPDLTKLYNKGDSYSMNLVAPLVTVDQIGNYLLDALELHDVEFVYIAGASNSTVWSYLQVLADAQFKSHRPTYFKAEAAMPTKGEICNDWAVSLVEAGKLMSARFVQVTASYGYITTARGSVKLSNIAGLEAGRTMAIPVSRATGRVRDGAIAGLSVPDEYTPSIQTVLEGAGFLTVKSYAGLNGLYFGESKTFAPATSDYRYQNIIRVVFKGLRLARVASLASMYDELGDPTIPADMTGAIALKAQISNSLDSMKDAKPKELVDYQIVIPEGQDFVANGVAIEMTFIGIPIINKIKIFANYTFAGSSFDPRLKDA